MVDRFTYPFAGVKVDGNFVTSSPPENLAGIVISESVDNSSDDQNILGGIPNDKFTLTTTGPRGILTQYPLVYVGTGGGGFIAGIAGPVKGGSVFGPPLAPAEFYPDYTPVSFVRLSGNVNEVNFTLTRGEAFDLTRLPALCFVEGSRVRTVRGDVAVETLIVGDIAVTSSGRCRRIIWTGCRRLTSFDGKLPFDTWPIRILRGAFGPDLPRVDLRLSPGHPVLIAHDDHGEGGVLVPAMCLINGTSIERVPVESVTYWHVELDQHDILVADGLPVESYIDLGSRAWFEDQSDSPLENPDFVPTGRNGRCRPVVTEGPLVEAERARLSGVFAASLDEACAWDEPERFGWIAA